MRDLWRMIEAVKAKGHMVRLAFFPGGNLNVAIYDSEKQMQQKMYDAHSYEQLEEMMRKDWGSLLSDIGVAKLHETAVIPLKPTGTLGNSAGMTTKKDFLPPLPKLPSLR